VVSDTIGDIVIARDLRSPLFNLANVIDDYEMKITHVIRGEDHITNTAKQILIQRALGFDDMLYAHLPLILTPDRKKLSKRSLETSFVEYIHDGYVPEALVNFLALLGWMPEDGKEILSLQEMTEKFLIKRVQKSGAAFNMEKLDWFNSQYIRSFSVEELLQRLKSFIPSSWYDQEDVLKGAIRLERERIKTLAEFKDVANFFFTLPEYDTHILSWKDAPLTDMSAHLSEVRCAIDTIDINSWNVKDIESCVLPITEKRGRGDVFWPLRVSLCGQKDSPGPFEIMEVIGKDETLQRIDTAVAKIAGALATPSYNNGNGNHDTESGVTL